MPGRFSIQWLRWRARLGSTLIVACTLLVACGSNDANPTATVPSEPSATPQIKATALSGPPRIGPAVWTDAINPLSNEPSSRATPIIGDSTIYAVFPIESLPAGSQLVGSWYFNDTSLDALNSAMRIGQDHIAGWIEFHIERTVDGPWPEGVYAIVVTDGTNELQRAEITIS